MGKLIYEDSKGNQTEIRDLSYTHLSNARNKLIREDGDELEIVILSAACKHIEDNLPTLDEN